MARTEQNPRKKQKKTQPPSKKLFRFIWLQKRHDALDQQHITTLEQLAALPSSRSFRLRPGKKSATYLSARHIDRLKTLCFFHSKQGKTKQVEQTQENLLLPYILAEKTLRKLKKVRKNEESAPKMQDHGQQGG